MSSIADQVLAAMQTALVGIAGVGDNVYRSRELAILVENMPSIAIMPSDEETTVFSSGVDDNQMTIKVEVNVVGDAYDAIADPICVAVHAALRRDAGLAALITQLRKKGKEWDAQQGDQTIGCVTTKYEVRYLSDANDITRSI